MCGHAYARRWRRVVRAPSRVVVGWLARQWRRGRGSGCRSPWVDGGDPPTAASTCIARQADNHTHATVSKGGCTRLASTVDRGRCAGTSRESRLPPLLTGEEVWFPPCHTVLSSVTGGAGPLLLRLIFSFDLCMTKRRTAALGPTGSRVRAGGIRLRRRRANPAMGAGELDARTARQHDCPDILGMLPVRRAIGGPPETHGPRT